MKYYNLILLLVIHCTYAIGQQRIDFRALLIQNDTIENPNVSLKHLRKGLYLIDQESDSVKGVFYYNLGVSYGMLYKIDSANSILIKAAKSSEKASDYLTQIGSYNGLANVARINGENELASDYFQKALDIAQKNTGKNFMVWESKLLGNIAGIFFDLGKYQSAYEYSYDAFVLAEELRDSSAMAISLVQIGYCLNKLHKSDSAFKVNRRATRIFERINDNYSLVYQYYNLGDIYLAQNDQDSSKFYFQKCKVLAKKFSEFETLAGSLNNLASIALRENNLVRANELADESGIISEEHELLSHHQRNKMLKYEIALASNKLSDAIVYLNENQQLKDSIQSLETVKSVEEFKVKYETAEKEKELLVKNAELVEKKRFQQFLITVILITILASIMIVYLQRQKSRLKQQTLQAEINELRVEIKNHALVENKSFRRPLEDLNRELDHPISEREYDVLQNIFTNKTNKEIADELFVSVNTVKYHLKNIYDKLGVSSRKEVLAFVGNNQDSSSF